MQIKYSQDHQYIIVEDGVGTVGITNHAQEKLSDVTTVELPHVAALVAKGSAVGVVESVKAASEIYSPVSGEILGVNESLSGKPELVNEDAEGAGWIYKIKLTSHLNSTCSWIGKLISLSYESRLDAPRIELRRFYAN
jgi:glycine cleavage system H protein